MPLDGLRAWIGEVERKLGVRTRVFLVLTVIAIGGAGAAIYLAVDARDSSVSKSDVQALQQQLEAQIGAGGAGANAAQLETELQTLKAQVEQLSGEGNVPAEGTSGGASEGAGKGATHNGGASNPKLQKLLEQASKQNAQAEQEHAGR